MEESLELIVNAINTEGGTEDAEDNEDRLVSTEYNGIQIWAVDSTRAAERMERQRERRIEGGNQKLISMSLNHVSRLSATRSWFHSKVVNSLSIASTCIKAMNLRWLMILPIKRCGQNDAIAEDRHALHDEL